MLSCEPRALRAVARTEAGEAGGFNDDETPVILFERHKFEERTAHQFTGARVPNVSEDWAVVSWPTAGAYGPSSVQHRRLTYAGTLDRTAALKSASWGLFQILGENHSAAGFPVLQDFINAMYRSVDEHLRALVMFIRGNPRMLEAIQKRDWPEFALRYNGPAYRKNNYDVKMARAYAEFA